MCATIPPPPHRVLSVGGLRRRRRVYRESESETGSARQLPPPSDPSDTCCQHEKADERDRRGEHRHHHHWLAGFGIAGTVCKEQGIDTDVRAGIPFGPHAFGVLATERERGSQSDPAPIQPLPIPPFDTKSGNTHAHTRATSTPPTRRRANFSKRRKRGAPAETFCLTPPEIIAREPGQLVIRPLVFKIGLVVDLLDHSSPLPKRTWKATRRLPGIRRSREKERNTVRPSCPLD